MMHEAKELKGEKTRLTGELSSVFDADIFFDTGKARQNIIALKAKKFPDQCTGKIPGQSLFRYAGISCEPMWTSAVISVI